MKKLFILFFFPIFCFGQNYTHKLDSVILYRLDSNFNYINHDKTTFVFDANNNQTLNTIYTWDVNTSSWLEAYNYEYNYDANNNQTLEIRYDWDVNTGSWVEEQKYEYNYDANNNLLLRTKFII